MQSSMFINMAKLLFYPQNFEKKDDRLNYQLIILLNIFLIPLIALITLFSINRIFSLSSLTSMITDIELYIYIISLGTIISIYILNHTKYYYQARNVFVVVGFILMFFFVIFPTTSVIKTNPLLIITDITFFNIIIIEFANIFYSFKHAVLIQLTGISLFLFFYFFYNPLPEYLSTVFLVVQIAFLFTISILIFTNAALRNKFYQELQIQKNQLEEAEEQFRTLFVHSPVPMWLFDLTYVQAFLDFLQRRQVNNIPNYLESDPELLRYCIALLKILDINASTLQMFHSKDKNELIFQLPTIFDLYFEAFSQAILKYAQGKTEYQLETTTKRRSNDTNLTHLIKWTLLPSRKESPLRALVVMVDITERKHYEHELMVMNVDLQKKNELITNIRNNIPIITFRTDHEFVFHELEGSGLKYLAKKESDYINKSLFELFPQTKDITKHIHDMKTLQFAATGDTNGSTWFFNVYLIPTRSFTANSSSIETVGFAINVTEEKINQQRVLESEKLAVLGQMVAGIAHEINNPLAYINSNTNSFRNFANTARQLVQELTDLILQHALVGETQIQKLYSKFDWNFLCEDIDSLIQDNINGQDLIEKVVSDLRSYSYQDTSIAESFSPVDLNVIIQQAVKIMSYKDKTRIDYIIDLVPGINILGISTKLSQIFLNLFKNSSQAILTKGVIRVTSRIIDNFVEIKVWDNGCGIDPMILKNLFQPFITTKKGGKGMGLGLMIIKTIVEEHKGLIRVQSEINTFTEFVILFPLIKEPLQSISEK